MPPSSIAPSSSRLLSLLAPDISHPSVSQPSSPAAAQARSLPVANGPPPRPSTAVAGPSSVPEQRRPLAAQGPSRTSTSASVNIPSSAPSHRLALNTGATKAPSAPSGPGASNLLGLGVLSPTTMNSSSPLADDTVESFRQLLKRLQKEEEEYRQSVEKTQQAMARQQHQAARWHAHAESTVEKLTALLEMVEQRGAVAEQRIVQLEEEATQRTEELRQVRGTVTQLEETNATLRQELEDVRIQAVERERADAARISEAIAKAAEALQTAENREHERQLADTVIRTKAQENRARWEARERELLAQLEEQKRQAALAIHALEQQVDALKQQAEELKRVEKKEKELRMEELREEKRKLQLREEQLQAQMELQIADGLASGKSTGIVAAVTKSLPSTSSISSQPTAAPVVSNPAPVSVDSPRLPSEKARRVKELHISTTGMPPHESIVAGSSHASSPVSTNECKLSVRSPQLEPLLAVKAEDDKCVVKPEVMSPVPERSSHPLSEEHPPASTVREQRREQSLDYAPLPQEPAEAPTVAVASGYRSGMSSDAAGTSAATANSHIEAHPVSQLPSPVVSFGGDSPEPSASHIPSLPLFLPSADSSLDDVRPPGNASTSTDARLFSGGIPTPATAHPTAPIPSARRQTDSLAQLPRPPSPPVMQRVPSDGQRRFRIRRGDHYSPGSVATYPPRPESPPPQNQRGDHWSPEPDREPDVSRRRYTPPVRHKRTRDDEGPSDAPNPRRTRLTGDSYRPGPPPSQRVSSQPDGPMYVDGPRRTPPRPPSSDASFGYPPIYPNYPPSYPPHPQASTQSFSRQEPPPARPDRARTPPYPPGHHLHQYAPPEPPTVMNDAEDQSSSQVVPIPGASVPASSANAQSRVAAAKKPPSSSKRNAAPGPRDAPVGPTPQAADEPGRISLINRMGMGDDTSGATGGEDVSRGRGEGSNKRARRQKPQAESSGPSRFSIA
ncbi:hypothetical protein C8T65DRAFT_741356 [Cerioporus squamosus]|nr:hypothetical protein C8T65DRAFT_741356 [Cerioporus squamosus]